MVWTSPKTWAVGDPATAADFNTYIRDNSNFVANAKAVSTKIASNTTFIANATTSTLSFDTEDFDTDNFHNVAVNTSRLTVPTGLGGKYRVWAIVEFGANATGHRSINFLVNGAVIYAIASVAASISSGAVPTLNGSRVLSLAAGAFVELQAFQDSGGTLTYNANNYTAFGMELVGF